MKFFYLTFYGRKIGAIVKRKNYRAVVAAKSIYDVRPIVDNRFSHVSRFCVSLLDDNGASYIHFL